MPVECREDVGIVSEMRPLDSKRSEPVYRKTYLFINTTGAEGWLSTEVKLMGTRSVTHDAGHADGRDGESFLLRLHGIAMERVKHTTPSYESSSPFPFVDVPMLPSL